MGESLIHVDEPNDILSPQPETLMTISLNAELQRFIEQKVKSGEFASADEAVNRLLSFVRERDEIAGPELEGLRREIAVGLEQAQRGELEDWDPDGVWEEVERRYAGGRGNRLPDSGADA